MPKPRLHLIVVRLLQHHFEHYVFADSPETAISAFGRPHRGSRCATRVAPRPPGDGRPGSQEAMTRGEALDDRGALARRVSARAS
jgi:hypothetical protein